MQITIIELIKNKAKSPYLLKDFYAPPTIANEYAVIFPQIITQDIYVTEILVN